MRNDNPKPEELLKAETHINFLENLSKAQKEIWQPFYEEALTNNDVKEIHNNIIQFGELALRWCKNSKQNKNIVIESGEEN